MSTLLARMSCIVVVLSGLGPLSVPAIVTLPWTVLVNLHVVQQCCDMFARAGDNARLLSALHMPRTFCAFISSTSYLWMLCHDFVLDVC